MGWRVMLILTASLAFSVEGLGNAGVFSGGGANLRISRTDQIQMRSERIDIRLIPSDGPVTGNLKNRDMAEYTCHFILKNLSEETVTVQVGFPLTAVDSPRSAEYVREHEAQRKEEYQFVARSGETDYDTFFAEMDGTKKYNYVFAWEMTFSPHQEVELEVSYTMSGYNGVADMQKRPYDFRPEYPKPYLSDLETAIGQIYPYVTQTGNSWVPPIEKAVFTLHHQAFEDYLEQRGPFDETSTARNDKHRIQMEIFQNGSFYRYINVGHWERRGGGEILRWEESPFDPPEEIQIAYFFTVFPKTIDTLDPLLDLIGSEYNNRRTFFEKAMAKAKEEGESDRHARLSDKLRNEYAEPFSKEDRKNIADVILEFYGIPTGNPVLTEFLEKQSWYPVKEKKPIQPELKEELLRLHRGHWVPQ